MMNTRIVTILLSSLAIVALLGSPYAHAANKDKNKGKGKFVAGSNKSFSWSSMGINECREAKKPILLYIFDDTLKKVNTSAEFYETKLFPDKDVIPALADYTCVMLRFSLPKGWPATYFTNARQGAVVYLMTADGQPLATYIKNHPNPAVFALQTKQIKEKNPAVLERMAKNPPPKFVEPKGVVREPPEKAEGENDPEKKSGKTAGHIPGLEDKDEAGAEGGKEGNSTKPVKKPRIEDEEE